MKRLIVLRSRVVEGVTGTRTIYTLRLTHTSRPIHITLGLSHLLPLGVTNHLPERIIRRHTPLRTAPHTHPFCHALSSSSLYRGLFRADEKGTALAK